MKKIGYVFILMFLLGLFLMACESPPRQQLADTGIFGEHKLMRIESFGSVTGSVRGSFFLGIGSVSGSIGSEFKLQFYWEPKPGEIVVSSLPYSKFRFVVDSNKQTPTIEFLFDSWWADETTGKAYRYNDKLNVNDFVMSGNLKIAVVRISKETLEKEVYLPKTK